MKQKIKSSRNIFTKFNINIKKNNFKNDNSSKFYTPNPRKLRTINHKNYIIKDHSYIPKQSILKILVRNQKNTNLIDENNQIIIPLRNKICNYQTKNEIVNKEINKLRNETKSFLNQYKISGFLTPKNESQYIKLGINKKVIKDIESEGHKMNDILNKTNIFDKSLLLIKRYDNFARNIMEEKNSELINDNKYIIKMNESLNERTNSDYFTYNINSTDIKNSHKIDSVYKSDKNNKKFEEEKKVSIQQLINEFKIISNDLKMINNKKYLKEKKHKKLFQKEIIKKTIQNSKNKLIKIEKNDKGKNSSKKNFPSIKQNENIKESGNLSSMNNISKNSNNVKEISSNNEDSKIEKNNKISLANFKEPKRKTVFKNIVNYSTNKDSSNKSLNKKFKLSASLTYNRKFLDILKNKSLNKENNDDKSYKSIEKNYSSINKMKRRIKNARIDSLINKKLANAFSIDDSNQNIMNKTEYSKSNSKIIKSKIEEYKKQKNCFLQNLYNNIKIKRFNENKKDISDYLKMYKGISIKEPNYETGSQIYNMINDFITKTKDYNLTDEIYKIRSKTNVLYYKRTKKFEDILKLNNKLDNLIYDYVEDILDLNNDIKI